MVKSKTKSISNLGTFSNFSKTERSIYSNFLKIPAHLLKGSRGSYLEDRTQMCSINGLLSSSCSLSCGVLQGTSLGPLLFLLYINDLHNCLSNCDPRMYADDTHLACAINNIHNIQTSLKEDLKTVHIQSEFICSQLIYD